MLGDLERRRPYTGYQLATAAALAQHGAARVDRKRGLVGGLPLHLDPVLVRPSASCTLTAKVAVSLRADQRGPRRQFDDLEREDDHRQLKRRATELVWIPWR